MGAFPEVHLFYKAVPCNHGAASGKLFIDQCIGRMGKFPSRGGSIGGRSHERHNNGAGFGNV